ncbi:DUF4242 domain-containing protein [Sphingomicrobium sediminis]|uniref:DUF4242 domain-containing protein n=1 Tax=Sphingomicrobium sediminis TaxID=2950949 RepID=A0A9X2J3P4_9SPHN|nr:DUF4242 domain-containing protein [Sphingomicrobium sediminis]MCM8558265.1 DUF4242 domain-containing protein [Sphingomicrobium sediminis]
MPQFVIEREMPGAGNLGPDDLKGASQKSCSVVDRIDGLEWVHSYVTGDKIYCIYNADDAAQIRDHAEQSGFPANSIAEVRNVISPATAEI